MEPYLDLGIYTRGTSTASTSAQTWFDRGLVCYAFQHEEAVRYFERALEHDRGFTLAHWGIAYAIGPNYNKQWEAFDPVDLAASLEKACDEVAAARPCTDRAAPVERALVEALGSRYQVNDPSADLVAWNADYAKATAPRFATGGRNAGRPIEACRPALGAQYDRAGGTDRKGPASWRSARRTRMAL